LLIFRLFWNAVFHGKTTTRKCHNKVNDKLSDKETITYFYTNKKQKEKIIVYQRQEEKANN
jgi:hypothetical protein